MSAAVIAGLVAFTIFCVAACVAAQMVLAHYLPLPEEEDEL